MCVTHPNLNLLLLLLSLKDVVRTGNRLSEFPRHIMHLTTMHEINLASNRIQEIPREFLFNNMAMTIKRMYLQNNFLVQVRRVLCGLCQPSFN
jgi:hypothetical protein